MKFSCNGTASLHCVDVSGCPEFNLEFIGVKASGFQPDNPIINSTGGGLKVLINPASEDSVSIKGSQTEGDMEWDLAIYRYRDGKQMFSQTIHGKDIIVNTKDWEKGLDIVNIVFGGEVYTKIVKI